MQSTKLMAPPTDCLSPIGERLIKRGLKNVLGNLRPEFYAPPLTRDPAVYAGNPFQVEVGIVYGGDLPADQAGEVLRFANPVPPLYQAGGFALAPPLPHGGRAPLRLLQPRRPGKPLLAPVHPVPPL